MLMPLTLHFTDLEQWNLTASTGARLLMACAMGGVIGMEREWRHKASGLRTNMLLCMGCALFTVLSAALVGESPDKSRIASNIVQGIGFLGAGLILHTRSRVLGLTSAATVFVVAAIGMACGAGLYFEAAVATMIVFVALQAIGMLEGNSKWKRYPLIYEVRGTNATAIYTAILRVLDQAGYRLSIMERDSLPEFERVAFSVTANRLRHTQLLTELKASAATDTVIAFPDSEQD
jgi:putative Mg2+ transporter-C (MgtC) family protein